MSSDAISVAAVTYGLLLARRPWRHPMGKAGLWAFYHLDVINNCYLYIILAELVHGDKVAPNYLRTPDRHH